MRGGRTEQQRLMMETDILEGRRGTYIYVSSLRGDFCPLFRDGHLLWPYEQSRQKPLTDAEIQELITNTDPGRVLYEDEENFWLSKYLKTIREE